LEKLNYVVDTIPSLQRKVAEAAWEDDDVIKAELAHRGWVVVDIGNP
jgi:hypothetical protein